ncbi:MAG: aldehyde dehydrogenase family protein [Eubacterium sp.]|nr:aldehyde dehydrogenase family protein [Eubacterium sp.]
MRKRSIVLKPSLKAEKCSYELYTIISNIMSKYNDKILNFLPGINDTEMINVLSAFEFSAILFTGKSETAKIIKKYIGRIPGIFETDSSAMAYVHIDKGYEKVAKELAQASFAQSGMRCIGLKNLFVHKNTIANLLPFLLEQVYQLSVGEPLNYETDIGPIYDNQVVDRTLELINQCSKQNFKLLCGGEL